MITNYEFGLKKLCIKFMTNKAFMQWSIYIFYISVFFNALLPIGPFFYVRIHMFENKYCGGEFMHEFFTVRRNEEIFKKLFVSIIYDNSWGSVYCI